ncbi:MAG: hypothetical protein Fur009_5570 [Candidatus Microgenomates bacterium]
MLKKIFNYFKNRPGLIILILLLSVITALNIKPDFYLMGWDNYSSYFNLKTNIFRTFFATWREYRGLGVPSDSESTDLFRQLFFLILSPFVKQELLDQIFSFFSFNLGVILIYLLSKKLFKGVFQNNEQKLDLVGVFSGLFYIFNLNTLATFYFPMIMYINRFYTIPLLFYIFLILIQDKITWKKIIFYSFLIIASSGTYMTATIFITVVINLWIFLLIQSQNFKKSLVFLFYFILLNSFWLLSFINYTMNKSSIVYQAPTFIDANEIQLNKPASFYSIFKQLILYPNFFDVNITSFNNSQTSGIHPLSKFINYFPNNFILSIFSLFYLCGAVLLLINYKKYKKFLWISSIIFLYLFLSLKAFSPLGFVYVFLEKNIPFFGSLFRFGDTKFHYFISFAGSLSAGFFITKISERLNKKNILLLLSTLLIILIIIYNSYFNGHFFGFFDLNKVPSAYFEIAKLINNDKDDYRVLHLPFNQDRYWRSYNWGYLGSSFLHFFINKPLIEKTFEPASQENAELNREIYKKISKKSDDLYFLLKKTGIKYIIFDETVYPQITAKGLGSWGTYNYFDSKEAIKKLESEGLLSKTASYNVNISDYLDTYEKVFSFSQDDLNLIKKTSNYEIILYELKDPDPKFQQVDNFSFTDPKTSEFNTDPVKDTLQEDKFAFEISPFKRSDLKFKFQKGKIETNIDNFNFVKNLNYKIEVSDKDIKTPQVNIEVYAQRDEKNLHLYFYSNPFPNLIFEDQILSVKTKIKEILIPANKIVDSLQVTENLENYLSNWGVILPYKLISGLRIKIGDNIIPFPLVLSKQETYVGSLILDQGFHKVQILKENSDSKINLNRLNLTDNPNCFSDKLDNYSSSVDYNNGQFKLYSQNGSTCFTLSIDNYLDKKANYSEIKVNYLFQSQDLDKKYLKERKTSKPVLQSVVKGLSKPDYLSVCIKDNNVDDCFNTHQILSLESFDSITIPTEKEINAYEPIIFFTLKNIGYQSQTLIINQLSIKKFEAVLEDILNVKLENNSTVFTVKKPQKLKISFNLPLNYFSFYQGKKDGFFVSNGVCNQPNSYRTYRQIDKLISYFENCDNNFFQSLDFDSNNSYLWLLDYNLASGKFPRFNLGDGFNSYTNQILSLNQGYPNIHGFKEFQNPEFFANKQNILNKIQNLRLTDTSIFLPSNSAVSDQKKKNFMIAHDSENEGMAIYDNFNVVQIPNIWTNLSIGPENNSFIINQTSNVKFAMILPSLWKINIDSSDRKKQVILFNEGYDKQWGIYASFFDLLIGKKAIGNHYKCNAYANCFEISSQNSQFYIFYWPEKLNVLGWVLTLLIILFGKRIVSN